MDKISQDQLDELLGYVAANNPEDIRVLLRRNGYNSDSLASNDLTIAFLKAIKDNGTFRQDVADYLTGMLQHSQQMSFVSNSKQTNFNVVSLAEANTGVAGATDPVKTTTSTTTSGKSSFWDNLASSQNVNSLLNTGLSVLSTSLQSKANKDSEERALQAKALDLQIAQTNAAAAAAGGNKKPVNVWAIVGIIGGLAVIGMVIYLVSKKGKKSAA
jgi:hypothetical protein